MTKKLFLVLILLIVAFTNADASKSTGKVHAFMQPDGTTIMVRLLGDEDHSWYQTIDGVLLKRVNKTFYIAKTMADGTLASTGVIAHNLDSRNAEEQSAAKAQQRSLFFAENSSSTQKAKTKQMSIAGYPSTRFCPHHGKVKVPVILMEFAKTDSDCVEFTFDKDVFETYFNGTTKTPCTKSTLLSGYSSVAQYFRDASFGDLDIQFDLYGPYTTDKGHDYYGHHDGDNYIYGAHRSALLTEAVKKSDADIDFTQYDSDGNGYVDMVYILYAGTGANSSGDENDFWPACLYYQSISTADGKTINVIGGASELLVSAEDYNGTAVRSGVGVPCHEMSHGMGLPDLYWTSSVVPKDAQGYVDYNNCGPEDWDLMDGGENVYNAIWPCQYAAWEREMMGWMTLEDLTEPCDVTIYPLNKEDGKAYRITNPQNPYEYYVIENYMSDEWNYYITHSYGTGLMITHVNASSSGLSMACNNTYGKPSVTLLPADGFILADFSEGETIQYKGKVVTMPSSSDLDETGKYHIWDQNYFIPDAKGDPYVGTEYTGEPVTAVAAYKNYTGEDMVTTYPITDITRNDDGSISFKFMGGEPSAIANVRMSDDKTDTPVYTIDGRKMGTDSSVLPHGIYIKNGRKFIK